MNETQIWWAATTALTALIGAVGYLLKRSVNHIEKRADDMDKRIC